MSGELTSRQAAFVAAYVQSGNAAEAARQAGYSAKGAASAGNNLLNTPKVADAIDALRRGRRG